MMADSRRPGPTRAAPIDTPLSFTGDPLTDALIPVVMDLRKAILDEDLGGVIRAFSNAETILGRMSGRAVADEDGLPAVAGRALAVLGTAMMIDDRSPGQALRWFANPAKYRELLADHDAETAANLAASDARRGDAD